MTISTCASNRKASRAAEAKLTTSVLVRWVLLLFIAFSVGREAAAMAVFIKMETGETLTLEVESSDSIQQVKQKINDIRPIPVSTQRLFFSGRLLEDGRTLADYNVQKEANLHLIVRTSGEILFVNQAVSGGDGSGNSWVNAIRELGDALERARQQNSLQAGTISEVWVAAGTYKPTHFAGPAFRTSGESRPNIDRDKAFVLQRDVTIYGSFAGTEFTTSTRTLEPPSTILSGDIGVQGDATDNCFHVVVAAGDMGTARLDGFVISDGNAERVTSHDNVVVNSRDVVTRDGAGISSIDSGAVFANLVVQQNIAEYFGAGANTVGPAKFDTVEFLSNTADRGAGLQALSAFDVYLTNCTFRGNSAPLGGAINFSGTPVLTNCLMSGNHASSRGGAIAGNGSMVLTNVTLTGNRGDEQGGAIRLDSGQMLVRNSLITGNASPSGPDVSLQMGAGAQYRSSLLGLTFYNGEGTPSNPGGTSTNNLFVAAVAAASAPTTAGDYNLKAVAYAVNRGENSYFGPGQTPDLSNVENDLRGYARFQGNAVDLGAYEYGNIQAAVGDWELY